jgi:hypothetical protein
MNHDRTPDKAPPPIAEEPREEWRRGATWTTWTKGEWRARDATEAAGWLVWGTVAWLVEVWR